MLWIEASAGRDFLEGAQTPKGSGVRYHSYLEKFCVHFYPVNLRGNRPADLRGNRPADLRGNRPAGLRGNRPADLRGDFEIDAVYRLYSCVCYRCLCRLIFVEQAGWVRIGIAQFVLSGNALAFRPPFRSLRLYISGSDPMRRLFP